MATSSSHTYPFIRWNMFANHRQTGLSRTCSKADTEEWSAPSQPASGMWRGKLATPIVERVLQL